jgi:hypothetical protein
MSTLRYADYSTCIYAAQSKVVCTVFYISLISTECPVLLLYVTNYMITQSEGVLSSGRETDCCTLHVRSCAVLLAIVY